MITTAATLALVPCAVHAPRWILGLSLEDNVDAALPVTVAVSVLSSLLLNVSLLPTKRPIATVLKIACGLGGLAVGAGLFHLVIILFGAPIQALIQRTALLALLLASMTTCPLAIHCGVQWNDWIDIVFHLRARDDVEIHLASVALGATVGAYVGALPIPLDWDRPWQQWPLTCVYGVLGGCVLGHLAGHAIVAWIRKSKTA